MYSLIFNKYEYDDYVLDFRNASRYLFLNGLMKETLLCICKKQFLKKSVCRFLKIVHVKCRASKIIEISQNISFRKDCTIVVNL